MSDGSIKPSSSDIISLLNVSQSADSLVSPVTAVAAELSYLWLGHQQTSCRKIPSGKQNISQTKVIKFNLALNKI